MLITDATPYSIYWPTMLSKERHTREYKDELTVAQLSSPILRIAL